MNRKLTPLAALALIAMVALISACGSSAPAATGGGSDTANAQKAVKFAECMRSNGVSEFPDPGASGKFTIDAVANGSSLNPSTPAFKQAISACKDLEPAGFTGSKRSPQQQEAASSSPSASATTACRTSRTPPRTGPSSTRIESPPPHNPGV